jgi:hypothetical protein
VGKPEVKIPPGRPRPSWKIDTEMNFQEFVFEFMYWIDLAQDRDRWQALLNAVMNFRFSRIAGNFLAG